MEEAAGKTTCSTEQAAAAARICTETSEI